MEDNGDLGSFASGGAFELVLRETPYCDPCSTCTTYLLVVPGWGSFGPVSALRNSAIPFSNDA